jgi:exodeoxyribonuclease VII large subunit
MVIRSREELSTRVISAAARLHHGIRLVVMGRRNRVQALAASRAFGRARAVLDEARQRHDEASTRLVHLIQDRSRGLRERLVLAAQRLSPRSLKGEVAGRRGRVGIAAELLVRAMRGHLRALREEVAGRQALLSSLSPLAVLERGYAIVHDETAGSVVSDALRLEAGREVRVQVARGRFGASVTWVEPQPAPDRKGRRR